MVLTNIVSVRRATVISTHSGTVTEIGAAVRVLTIENETRVLISVPIPGIPAKT